MTSLAVRIIAVVVAALALAIAVMWVIGLGPFNQRPSAAAKLQPKVTAAVGQTQARQGGAVAKAEGKTRGAIAETEKRTEAHVARIRAAAPRAAPADVPDREFYRGVCEHELYAGSEDCRRFGR